MTRMIEAFYSACQKYHTRKRLKYHTRKLLITKTSFPPVRDYELAKIIADADASSGFSFFSRAFVVVIDGVVFLFTEITAVVLEATSCRTGFSFLR
jgi:hypothetical protein